MDNTDTLTAQPIAAEEAEAVLPLSAEAGWNQTASDWRFMLANGRAFGVRDVRDKRWIGSALELPLGFRDLYAISRWHLDGARFRPAPVSCTVRQLMTDIAAVDAFDTPRSGMARSAVLRYLARHAPGQAFVAEQERRVIGYALGRPGRIAPQIGPLVADDEAVALALLQHALSAVSGRAI